MPDEDNASPIDDSEPNSGTGSLPAESDDSNALVEDRIPHGVTDVAKVVKDINEDFLPRAGVELGAKKRDLHDHRFLLAVSLLWIVAATVAILTAAVTFAHDNHLDAIGSVAGIVFGPLVTLLGTSFAWYFAKQGSE